MDVSHSLRIRHLLQRCILFMSILSKTFSAVAINIKENLIHNSTAITPYVTKIIRHTPLCGPAIRNLAQVTQGDLSIWDD